LEVSCRSAGAPAHLAPRGLALASPLPRTPLPNPRADPPLAAPRTSVPPRLLRPDGGLAVDAGVANFEMDFEDGGFSTKDVSVVLGKIYKTQALYNSKYTHRKVVSPSKL
jgi:hypothetical protein